MLHYHNCGPACTGATCPDWTSPCGENDCEVCGLIAGLDAEVMHMQGLTAAESTAASERQREAGLRAAQVYVETIGATGNTAHAKLAARFAAAGRAMTDRAVDGSVRDMRETGENEIDGCYYTIAYKVKQRTANIIMNASIKAPPRWSWRPVGAKRSKVTGLASREAAIASLELAGYHLAYDNLPHWIELRHTGECVAPSKCERLRFGGETYEYHERINCTGQMPLFEQRPAQVSGFACN